MIFNKGNKWLDYFEPCSQVIHLEGGFCDTIVTSNKYEPNIAVESKVLINIIMKVNKDKDCHYPKYLKQITCLKFMKVGHKW